MQWYGHNCRSFPAFTKWVVLWNRFLNDLSVMSCALSNGTVLRLFRHCFLFVSTIVQLTYACPTTQKWGKQPPCTQGNERNYRKKPLEKPGAIVKMFNQGSYSLIYYYNKMYELICCVWCASSVTTIIRTIPLTYNSTKLRMINTSGNNPFST